MGWISYWAKELETALRRRQSQAERVRLHPESNLERTELRLAEERIARCKEKLLEDISKVA